MKKFIYICLVLLTEYSFAYERVNITCAEFKYIYGIEYVDFQLITWGIFIIIAFLTVIIGLILVLRKKLSKKNIGYIILV